MSELPYTVRSLFRGSVMAIADVRCRATTGSPGSEEVARGYDRQELGFPPSALRRPETRQTLRELGK